TSGAAAPDGAIDVRNGPMIADYSTSSPANAIRPWLPSGYANGAWTGDGIRSSVAASIPRDAVGFAEASSLGVGSFNGTGVDDTSVVISYTLCGDSNLDHTVD